MTSTMKKQFFRFKQVADQTFARAEKSEVLSEELLEAERKVESIKNTLHRMCKDLKDTLHGQGTDGTAINKRLRKMPEFLLATGLLENSQALGKESVLGQILSIYGDSEKDISSKRLEYEVCCEKLVIQPLKHIIDVEINEITKQRRALHKHVLDMDAAKARYSQAVRHSHTAGVTAQSTVSKVDTSREDMEEAQTKMEQCRDTLITDIFQLLARETEIATKVVNLVDAQKKYHQQALDMLESIQPDLQSAIKCYGVKPAFGQPLEEHLETTGREIAFPIEHCVRTLLELGVEEEGLFRVAGGASKVKKIKTVFDAGLVEPSSMDEYSDPHVVSSVLKSYLRELPEPLMTRVFYEEWMQAARTPDPEQRLKNMWIIVNKLPVEFHKNLRYMIKFLAHLASHQGTNRMSSQNLAIVMAPNLIWDPKDDPSNPVSMNMSIANTHSAIVDSLVSHVDYFFPGEEDFLVKSPKPTEETNLFNGPSVSVNGPSPASPRKENSSPGGGSVHKRAGSTGSWSQDAPTTSLPSPLQTTHSSTSLTEPPKENSSTSESPRPTLRRKNKPAPIPPVMMKSDSGGSPTVSEEPSPVNTLDRQSSQSSKEDYVIGFENFHKDSSNGNETGSQGKETPPHKHKKERPSSTPHELPPSPTPSPVPAARTLPRERPAVPERPAVFRSSVRSLEGKPVPAERSKGPEANPKPAEPLLLEKAHLYSVDKQQASIINVKDEPPPLPEKHKKDDPSGAIPFIDGSPDTTIPSSNVQDGGGDQPRRPPRPHLPPLAAKPLSEESTDL